MIKTCPNNSNNSPTLKFYRLPKHTSIAKKWIHAADNPNLNKKNSSSPRICSIHFEPKYVVRHPSEVLYGLAPPKSYRDLTKDAIPTLYLPERFETLEMAVDSQNETIDAKSVYPMEQIFVKEEPNSDEECEKPISVPLEVTVKQEIYEDFVDSQKPVNKCDILKAVNSDDIIKSEIEVEDPLFFDPDHPEINMCNILKSVNSYDDLIKSEIKIEDTEIFDPVYPNIPVNICDILKSVNSDDDIFKSEIGVEAKDVNNTTDEIYLCHICPIKFYKLELLDKHVHLHMSSTDQPTSPKLDQNFSVNSCYTINSKKEQGFKSPRISLQNLENLPKQSGEQKVNDYLQNIQILKEAVPSHSDIKLPNTTPKNISEYGCTLNDVYTNDTSINYNEEFGMETCKSSKESSENDIDDNDFIPDTESETSDSLPIPTEKTFPYSLTKTFTSPIEHTSPRVSNSEKYISSADSKFNLNKGKNVCPICLEYVGHFCRHLRRKHSDDETVKQILKMPTKSKERKDVLLALRKKGNFMFNQEQSIVKPVRKSKKNEYYFPCVDCLGFYAKKYLWRHRKICKSKVVDDKKGSSKIKHLTQAQTFLASSGLLGSYLNKSRLKNNVFSIMRPDEISHVAKNDPLICLFGESYLNKQERKQINVVSNKMRELARLQLALKKSTTIISLIEALKPEMYNHIIAAAKIISGYDPDTQTFKASSLALHLGRSLKFLCDIAEKAIITKDPLFKHDCDTNNKQKEILDLREMIESQWCNDLSSLANKVLNENKVDKPQILPLTEDVQAFNRYVTNLADRAYEKLKGGEDVIVNYKLLAECTLSIVLVFNRKRIGEVQFLDILSYKRNVSIKNQSECLSSLTELEKSTFKGVVVFGKGSNPVPILFTKRMQTFADILLKIRTEHDIVPDSNKYLFANPGSADKWMGGSSILRKFALKCGAKKPELLTSNRFRKEIATILQLMSFEKSEMEQLAKFMGHTEKTPTEFYRLTEDMFQMAKVAKVLILLNAGKGTEFKGKSLAEIQVDGDLIDDDENDMEINHFKTEINDPPDMTPNNDLSSELNPCNPLTKIDNKTINDSYSKTRCSQIKRGRVRWMVEEKKLVLSFFKKHIKTSTAPRKKECLNFIQQNPFLFKESDWVRIKTLVFNTYRNK